MSFILFLNYFLFKINSNHIVKYVFDKNFQKLYSGSVSWNSYCFKGKDSRLYLKDISKSQTTYQRRKIKTLLVS